MSVSSKKIQTRLHTPFCEYNQASQGEAPEMLLSVSIVYIQIEHECIDDVSPGRLSGTFAKPLFLFRSNPNR